MITKEDFQLILSNQSRRRRAIALMAHVLKGPVSMAQSMMDALECAGYKSLIRRINETNGMCFSLTLFMQYLIYIYISFFSLVG